jgi:hypothetical protein
MVSLWLAAIDDRHETFSIRTMITFGCSFFLLRASSPKLCFNWSDKMKAAVMVVGDELYTC